MSENQSAGPVQTLGKRKAQQQKAQNKGIVIGAGGQSEYDEDTLNGMIREALGYDFKYLYKDDQDEDTIQQMVESAKEEEIYQRHQKCEQMKDMLHMKLRSELLEQKALQNQDRLQKHRRQNEGAYESSSSSSSGESGEESSSSYDNPENKRNQKQDHKRQQKVSKDSSSEGSQRSYSQDDESDDGITEKVKSQQPQKHLPASQQRITQQQSKVQQAINREIVKSLDDLKKIILKRSKLEQWVEHIYFAKTVINCFARVSFKGKYSIAEIMDAKEEGPTYDIGKKQTNIQLELKFGANKKWFKLLLISNGEPGDQEFSNMIRYRQLAKDKEITLDRVQHKIDDLKKAKDFKYSFDQIEDMVSSKFEKKVKEGKLGGFNLSYQKIDLKNDIGLFQQKLKQTRDPGTIKEYQLILNDLIDKLQKVEEALKQQMEKDKSYFKTNEQGMEKVLTIEELEKKQEADEWMKQQEYYMRNPNQKKNNYFMKHLTREDSTKNEGLNDQERQQIEIQQELELIRLRSQASQQDRKKESFFDKTERQKRDYKHFHETLKFSFDDELKERIINNGIQIQQKPMEKEIKRLLPHPKWLQEYQRVCQEEIANAQSEDATVISFEQYLNDQ